MQRIYLLLLACAFAQLAYAQPRSFHAGELQLALKKLNVVGSVLYLAAHPDDENTALIAYFANERLMRTGYLSLTRGDGGQNLIGAEQRELMGLIRTQELIQARKTDGGEQFFTRANDFGFSKSAKEAQQIWDKEQVLADMVWVIRNFRPDVIVTRFPPSRDAGHGHHEASAILAEEAFKASADASRFPEQLKYVQTWQAKRLVWNAFWRRNGQFSNQPPDGNANIQYVNVELGNYNPLLGKSNLGIAAESRSMHKSQGFGAGKNHGTRLDNLQHTLGSPAKTDILDDLTLSWKRFEGTEGFSKILENAYQNYKPENPALIVPMLKEAYQKMKQFEGSTQNYEAKFWAQQKSEDLKNVLLACIGLWAEGNATEYSTALGDSLGLKLEVALRMGNVPLMIEKASIHSTALGKILDVDSLPKILKAPQLWTKRAVIYINPNEPTTQPYWLTEKPTQGLFSVKDQLMRGKPENLPAFKLVLQVKFQDLSLVIERPITYKWVKPEDTEIYRPLEVTPQVMVNVAQDAYLFAGQQSKDITFTLYANKANRKGQVSLQLPTGWTAEPALHTFQLKNKEEQQKITFRITPSANSQAGTAKLMLKLEGEEAKPAVGIQRIDYRHIPLQTVFPQAEIFLDRFDMQMAGKQIGYIEGAGDEVAQCLEQVGYTVTRLKADALSNDLSQFDAIVLGVRAYNTQNDLKNGATHLKKYVEQGGTVVVQYNTNQSLVTKEIGVYPLTLGRDRVTVEDAPVTFLLPEHALLNAPNKITQKDFEGWVQERGLYFAQKWDEKYETILASADPEEPALKGGLLYAKYGKGKYIYTGLAFFRQLPAGVKGAYRLFANLLAKP
ncbi:MAG: PIG-L family deacetylase [Bacteroidetes bacterium]|nr:MAG: PIG-L family deacetylase [Bacteroidota bacterium]